MQLGKVYLSNSGAAGETYFDADFARGGKGGAIAGAGKGAFTGLDACFGNALAAGALAPLVMLVCTPILVPVGMVRGSEAGSSPAIAEETLASLEQQANDLLRHADLGAALVATLDELGQQDAALAPYEISHGTLPAPEQGEPLHELAATWGYRTLLDIEVTRAGFDSDDGRVPMMHFAMTAEVRLLEAASGKLLGEQEYRYSGVPRPVASWFASNNRKIGEELVNASRQVAGDIAGNVFLK